MEVTGLIIKVQPVQTGEGRNGTWKKQEYVVEYDRNAQYPRRMMFNLWGDRIDQYNIQEGQTLRVNFDIDCREYQGRWYNDIRAWKIEAVSEGGNDVGAVAATPSMDPGSWGAEMNKSDETSDLPF